VGERDIVTLVPPPEGPIRRPELDLANAPSGLPAAGERLDAGLDYYLNGSDAALVPPGARSLVAPAMLISCNSGLVAVLRVPGDPAIVTGVLDDAEENDDAMRHHRGTDDAGRAWDLGKISTAGGYYLDVLAVADRPDSSLALITECGD
jgi:hypothetical protein